MGIIDEMGLISQNQGELVEGPYDSLAVKNGQLILVGTRGDGHKGCRHALDRNAPDCAGRTMTNTPNMPQAPITPRQLFLEMAVYYGIGPEVAAMLKGKPEPAQAGLGPTLRRARHGWGGTISRVFERSGISRSQIQFYEAGKQKSPGIRTVHALSYGYRLPFAEVVIAVLHDMAREVSAAPGADRRFPPCRALPARHHVPL